MRVLMHYLKKTKFFSTHLWQEKKKKKKKQQQTVSGTPLFDRIAKCAIREFYVQPTI